MALNLAALLGVSLLASSAGADELKLRPSAVIELFTSQGCASCPPADAMLEELSRRPDVIALAYHVDYWDYIGWPDTFGSAEHSERQRAYADAWGSNRIFTPQMVINGAKGVVGSRLRDVTVELARAELQLPVVLAIEDGKLRVDVDGQAGLEEAFVWLVTFIDRADVAIERGENGGRQLAYAQIVTGRQLLGVWEPGNGAHLALPLDEVLDETSNGAAVLIQADHDGLPGRILGAAALQPSRAQ